ncbi:MAG: tyrosinase family protein [Bryobacterales bacterium]|nr:tyrosinase family protein [Bryobacterales bacterium]
MIGTTLPRRAFAAGLLTPFVRVFAQSCAPPAGGLPQAFAVPTGQTDIVRKPISALTGNEITRLRLAYQRLRELNTSAPNNPGSLMQQANVHCWQCGGMGRDIHQTWEFLPWHRAYLYYHERILCKVLNDQTFRLPYWDWDVDRTRRVPSTYRRTPSRNSLFNTNRNTNDGSKMPSGIFPSNGNPMDSPNFAAFGGTADAGGNMENGPHGAIHVWTAGGSRADMGRLDTAARDPIFYAHHCNIDRLWAEWIRRNPTAHANPTAAGFLDSNWTFFDENGVLRRIRARDVLDSVRNLGYHYAPGAALAAPAPTKRIDLEVSNNRIKLPAAERDRLLQGSNGIAVSRALIVEGVTLPPGTNYYFVFANEPQKTGSDPSKIPNYVGYVAVIRGEHAHHERPGALALKATPQFLQLAGTPDGVALILKSTGYGDTSANGTSLAFKNVYLMEA